MNGLQQAQQSKGLPPLNGFRPNEQQKYSAPSSSSSGSGAMNPPSLTNGRNSSIYQKPNPKHELTAPLMPLSQLPTLPPQHAPPSTPSGGGDVESILKMMTSTMAPLSKIAATPRTELEVQQPSKQHVYAELPPLFKPPTKPAPISMACDEVKRLPPMNPPSQSSLFPDRVSQPPVKPPT